jgi:hypothetical protein
LRLGLAVYVARACALPLTDNPDMDTQPAKPPLAGKPAEDSRVNVYIDGYNFYVPLSTMDERHYELCWCDFLALSKTMVARLAAVYPNQFGRCTLGLIKYFTATIPENMPKNKGGVERKYSWLDALHYHTRGAVQIVHGTFRPRKHRFYIERDQLDDLARAGVPINWDHTARTPVTFHPHLRIHEEKQTDVMLACSVVTDAALGRAGRAPAGVIQTEPLHRSNARLSPSPCHAALIVSADIDFLPAAEMAASVFNCPVAVAFTFPHEGYNLNAMGPNRQLFTIEVSESELRRCMLPPEVVVPDGRRIQFERVKRSHFNRVNATGG